MNHYPSPTDPEDETLHPSPTTGTPQRKPEYRWSNFSVELLDMGDALIYIVVGVCFFIGSLFALGYSFWEFYHLLTPNGTFDPSSIGQAVIQLVSDLLLVLIIMEVLGTVTHYLKERATSLRPFLFIGIISATRGILSIGARLSIGATIDFRNDMIELGVNAAVILALGVTIKLLGSYVDDHS